LCHYLAFERDAFRIILGEPSSCRILVRRDLQVILVVDLLARVDVNPDRHTSSLICTNISVTVLPLSRRLAAAVTISLTVQARLPNPGGCEPRDVIPEALAQVFDLVGSITHVTGNVEAPLGFHVVSEEPQALSRVDVGVVLQGSAPIHVSACALPPMPRALARMTLMLKASF
jgi:hypothetical protein